MKTAREKVTVTDRHGKSAAAVLVTKTSSANRRLKVETQILIGGVVQVWSRARNKADAVDFLCEEFKIQIAK